MSNHRDSRATDAKKRWSNSYHNSGGPDHTRIKRPKQQQHLAPATPGASMSGGRDSEGAMRSRPGTPFHPGSTGQHHSATPGTKLERRSVATWTFQAGTEAPVSYFSAAPWKRQERARISKRSDRLFAPFQGRTITELDRQSNSACIPPDPGSVFCECGGLIIHESHEKSLLHRQRIAALGDGAPSKKSTELHTNAATEDVIRRARTDPQFAKWLLEAAAGTTQKVPAVSSAPSSCSSQSSPSPGTSTWPAGTDSPATPAAGGQGCSLIDLDFTALMAE